MGTLLFVTGCLLALQLLVLALQWRANNMADESVQDLQAAAADISAATGTIASFIDTAVSEFTAISQAVSDTNTQLGVLVAELQNGNYQGVPGLQGAVDAIKAARDTLGGVAAKTADVLAAGKAAADAAAGLDATVTADAAQNAPAKPPATGDGTDVPPST